jgi:hypothetical protein
MHLVATEALITEELRVIKPRNLLCGRKLGPRRRRVRSAADVGAVCTRCLVVQRGAREIA